MVDDLIGVDVVGNGTTRRNPAGFLWCSQLADFIVDGEACPGAVNLHGRSVLYP